MMFLFSFSVQAETITLEGKAIDKNLLIEPDDNGVFSLTYTESEATELESGQQIVLLVVKGIATSPSGLSISAANIRYIDQATSDGTKVEFLNFIPSSVPNFTVLLGGITGGPKIVGYIEAQPVSVSGKMSFISGFKGRVADVFLTELNPSNYDLTLNILEAQTNIEGDFLFPRVFEGVYELFVNVESHTSYTKKKVNVEEIDLFELNGNLIPGDVDGNGVIEYLDLSAVLQNYEKRIEHPADIDGNGTIEYLDLSQVLINYEKRSIVEE